MPVDVRQHVPLGEIAAEMTVGYVGPMASEYVSKGIPFLRSQNVESLRIDSIGVKYISPEFHKRLNKSALSPGDVVIVRTGKPGAAAVIPDWLPVSNCSDLVIVRPGPRLDARYLAYFINAAAAGHVSAHLVGAVQQHFNVASARSLPVPVLPIAEQHAIARILGALDDKIELNRRMNGTLEAMARAIFKSWFVDFDPVRAKADGRQPPVMDAETAALFPDSFTESQVGEIPKGWRWVPLSEAADLNPMRPLKKGVGAPYVEMSSLPTRGYRPKEWPLREAGSGARFENGDTLLARITPCLENGKTGYVDFLDANAVGWGSTEYIVIRPFAPLPTEWGYLLAREGAFRDFAIQKMDGTTGRQRVPVDSLGSYTVALPSPEIGKKFGGVIGSFFQKMSAAYDENQTLSELRDALLPKLLSGEVRVDALEGVVSANA